MLFIKYISDIYKESKEDLMKKYDNDTEMVDMEAVAENIKSIKSELVEVEAQMEKYLDELGLN